jgi:hypothetical protein
MVRLDRKLFFEGRFQALDMRAIPFFGHNRNPAPTPTHPFSPSTTRTRRILLPPTRGHVRSRPPRISPSSNGALL